MRKFTDSFNRITMCNGCKNHDDDDGDNTNTNNDDKSVVLLAGAARSHTPMSAIYLYGEG